MILTIFQSDFAESEESISSCKKREGELLEFTQRLTETNATLQVGYLPLPFIPHLTINIKLCPWTNRSERWNISDSRIDSDEARPSKGAVVLWKRCYLSLTEIVGKWVFALEAKQIRIFYQEDRRKCSSHTCHSPVRIDHLKSEVGGDSRGAFLTLKLRPRSGNGIGWHTGVTGRREADQVAGLWFSSTLTIVH